MKQLNANLDGIEHINIYSQGKTLLGRKLSNFAYSPFYLEKFGKFNSVEAFWFWLKCYLYNSTDYSELKTLDGYQAKKRGTEFFKPKEISHEDEIKFQEIIKSAIRAKLKQNKSILNLLVDSDLPLEHYYVFNKGKSNEFAKDLPEYYWIVEEIEQIRTVSKLFLAERNLTKF